MAAIVGFRRAKGDNEAALSLEPDGATQKSNGSPIRWEADELISMAITKQIYTSISMNKVIIEG
jgi:hypothetical protein